VFARSAKPRANEEESKGESAFKRAAPREDGTFGRGPPRNEAKVDSGIARAVTKEESTVFSRAGFNSKKEEEKKEEKKRAEPKADSQGFGFRNSNATRGRGNR